MAGVTFTWEERETLARKLGLDDGHDLTPDVLLRQAGKLAARQRAERSYADPDPSRVLKLDRDMPVERRTVPTSAADALIDGAVADGRIEPSERGDWHRRYQTAPELTREVLDDLPSDPERGRRAFAEDPRLRSLADAFDAYMGVTPDDRDYAADHPDPGDPCGILKLGRS